eukprot:TRINITY_DN5242_c1_g1_i1.p1 TRINITY_DN5242_c1_g1~~TRINITY_DN5242_c1_g1_i1.p1  ORF type:complete len:377 (+),score=49.46 TRINITY_DN5242_c1_g1_i1:47-1132(+)
MWKGIAILVLVLPIFSILWVAGIMLYDFVADIENFSMEENYDTLMGDGATSFKDVIKEGSTVRRRNWTKSASQNREGYAGNNCTSNTDLLVQKEWWCNHTTKMCDSDKKSPQYKHAKRCKNTPICCNSKTMLIGLRVAAALQQLKMPFMLTAGTLLGAKVYNGIIPYDTDFDVIVVTKRVGVQEAKFWKAFQREMAPYKMRVRRRPKTGPVDSYIVEWTRKNHNHVTLEVAEPFRRYLVPSKNTLDEDWNKIGMKAQLPIEKFFPVAYLPMYGWNFPVPADAVWWLQWQYGPRVLTHVARKGCTEATSVMRKIVKREPPFIPAPIALPEYCPDCCLSSLLHTINQTTPFGDLPWSMAGEEL